MVPNQNIDVSNWEIELIDPEGEIGEYVLGFQCSEEIQYSDKSEVKYPESSTKGYTDLPWSTKAFSIEGSYLYTDNLCYLEQDYSSLQPNYVYNLSDWNGVNANNSYLLAESNLGQAQYIIKQNIQLIGDQTDNVITIPEGNTSIYSYTIGTVSNNTFTPKTLK